MPVQYIPPQYRRPTPSTLGLFAQNIQPLLSLYTQMMMNRAMQERQFEQRLPLEMAKAGYGEITEPRMMEEAPRIGREALKVGRKYWRKQRPEIDIKKELWEQYGLTTLGNTIIQRTPEGKISLIQPGKKDPEWRTKFNMLLSTQPSNAQIQKFLGAYIEPKPDWSMPQIAKKENEWNLPENTLFRYNLTKKSEFEVITEAKEAEKLTPSQRETVYQRLRTNIMQLHGFSEMTGIDPRSKLKIARDQKRARELYDQGVTFEVASQKAITEGAVKDALRTIPDFAETTIPFTNWKISNNQKELAKKLKDIEQQYNITLDEQSIRDVLKAKGCPANIITRIIDGLKPLEGLKRATAEEKYIVGQIYYDGQGRKAKYLGNGKWQLVQ